MVNGMSYIGCSKRSVDVRWKDHVRKSKYGSKLHLHRAIAKYGVAAFKRSVIEECDNQDDMLLKEIESIKHFDTFNNGYNLTMGGEGRLGGTCKHTEESKLKMSLATKGKPKGKQSKDHIEKQRIQKRHNWIVTKPCGIKQQVSNLQEFCQNEGLSYQSFYKSYSEDRLHKGYKLEKSNGQ